MLKFQAEDGYSYIIEVKNDNNKYPTRVYRIDSEAIDIQLATNETIEIRRLDITREVSIKLSHIHTLARDAP